MDDPRLLRKQKAPQKIGVCFSGTANLEFPCNVRSYFHEICYEGLHFVKNSIQKRTICRV